MVRPSGWRLIDTSLPFSEASLPVGLRGAGRLVTVTVESASRASFAERGSLGPGRGLLVSTAISGEARLQGRGIRVVVYVSASSLLLVGGMAGLFILGGLHLFLDSPALGTAAVGTTVVLAGVWLALQIPKAGRDVAGDAAQVLEMMARGEGTPVFTPRAEGAEVVDRAARGPRGRSRVEKERAGGGRDDDE